MPGSYRNLSQMLPKKEEERAKPQKEISEELV